MMRLNLHIRLWIAFGILLACAVVSESFFRKQQPMECAVAMSESVSLTKKWFSVIEAAKNERGIRSDAGSNVPNKQMIGNDWSEITTSLGSLEAKEISTNPDFAALVVRLLYEAGIKKGDKVGVVLSGSFPSLSIAVLAALQTCGMDPLVMSSIGASTFGANQPEATWIDMESVLNRKGGLKFQSSLVSVGAGEDNGTGLSEAGLSCIHQAAYRNKIALYVPSSLKESIDKRAELYKKTGISLLINVGGNETALGNCAHALSIPNGLHARIAGCKDENRGLIIRMNELNVPFIQMLDIKELASRYGIDISPGISYAKSKNLYSRSVTNKSALGIILAVSLIPLYFLRKR